MFMTLVFSGAEILDMIKDMSHGMDVSYSIGFSMETSTGPRGDMRGTFADVGELFFDAHDVDKYTIRVALYDGKEAHSLNYVADLLEKGHIHPSQVSGGSVTISVKWEYYEDREDVEEDGTQKPEREGPYQ